MSESPGRVPAQQNKLEGVLVYATVYLVGWKPARLEKKGRRYKSNDMALPLSQWTLRPVHGERSR
jgi:hypothetical protein